MSKKVITIGGPLRKWQQFCINKLTRFNLWVLHRRGGKTYLAIRAIISTVLECEHANPHGAYLALTYASAKRIAWEYLKEFLEDYPDVRFFENELKASFKRPQGDIVSIYLLGTEDPKALRGMYLDIIVLDEKAFMRTTVDEVIMPTVSDRKGKVIQISSVNGRNQFYKDYLRYRQEMDSGNKNFFAIDLKASDTMVIDKEELELLKKNMTDEAYRQEYENDFSAGDVATFYGSQMETMFDEGRITRVPYDPMYSIDVFYDLGMNDMNSMWFRQVVGREYRYIHFYQSNGEAIPYYVNYMRSLYPNAVWGRVVLPHDAAVREFSTGKTRQETFTNMGVRTEIQPRQGIPERINAVRTHLPKCVFDANNCAEGIECLQNYRKKKDDRNDIYTNTPVHDKFSHGADAFGYSALDERPSVEENRRRLSDMPDRVEGDNGYDNDSFYGGW